MVAAAEAGERDEKVRFRYVFRFKTSLNLNLMDEMSERVRFIEVFRFKTYLNLMGETTERG